MNYTQNYQLPQWVTTDRVLMADFNDAMAKTDAAIAAVRMENPRPKLQTVAAQTAEQAISLSGVDWNKYWAVQIYFDLQFANTEIGGLFYLNNIRENGSYYQSNSNSQDALCGLNTSNSSRCTGVLQLLPGGSGIMGTLDCVASYPTHSQLSCHQVSADTLETVNVSWDESPVAGQYQIYGLLK